MDWLDALTAAWWDRLVYFDCRPTPRWDAYEVLKQHGVPDAYAQAFAATAEVVEPRTIYYNGKAMDESAARALMTAEDVSQYIQELVGRHA